MPHKYHIHFKRFIFVLLIVIIGFSTFQSYAQEINPENSSYLIERGISPRVLDAAASSLMQDGSFIQDVMLQSNQDGKEKEYRMQVIYDPSYTDGMDIRFVVDNSEVSEKDLKYLKKLVQNSHHFSRMSEPYLYDEKTLKLSKKEGTDVVFEFFYKKQDIEPYLKYIKRLKGYIIFKDGELDHIELRNIKRLKGGIQEYQRKVYFKHVLEQGGHVVSKVIETAVIEKRNTSAKISNTAITSEYITASGNSISLGDASQDILPPFADPDTVSVKLGWVLPLLGKPATKLGYKLPRPVGLDLFTHFQEQEMQCVGLSLAMNDEDFVSFGSLFEVDQSSISATSYATMVKADVWILPFLNVMGIVGSGQNDIYGNFPINEELKEGLTDYGWLIDIAPEDVPNGIELSSTLSSTMYGAGATLAGGVGDWNVSLSYQFMIAKVLEANTTSVAHVFMPMLGYMTPFGMNLMVGTQGQFYDTRVVGFVDLSDDQTLHYDVEFEPVNWNAMIGMYKGFAKHWEVALQAGFGNRNSVTAVFGYRF